MFRNNCDFLEIYLFIFIFQAQEERNYHVFYQMCAARDEIAELKNLHLDDPMEFYFTSQGNDPEIDGTVFLRFSTDYNYNKFDSEKTVSGVKIGQKCMS